MKRKTISKQTHVSTNASAAEPAGMETAAVAVLKFTERADGTLRIDASHSGDFDPALQAHACLRAVTQFLPQICAPAGTRVEGDTGIRLPISDADRYQAMRTLALIPEDARDLLLDKLADREPESEAEFDMLADKIVEFCRGVGLEKPAPLSLLPAGVGRLQ